LLEVVRRIITFPLTRVLAILHVAALGDSPVQH
jgi:hypothetical protein